MAGTVNLDIPEQVDSCRAMLLHWIWPPRCLLCGARGDGRDLCGACAAAMPWLGSACRRCALPLPLDAAAPERPGRQRITPGQCAITRAADRHGEIAPVAPSGEDGPRLLCGACLDTRSPVTETRAACLYRPPLDRLLPRFKFHHDLSAGRLLSQLMIGALAPAARRWTAPATLLPVPLHRARLRERGYDQALELARPLARALDLPMQHRALVRIRHTAPQSRLDASRRRRNLHEAFGVRPGARLPEHVVLVDDVMTTGATLHAAATALRRVGVERVDAWVCARVP